jgi:RecA-family ATPase
VLILDSEMDEDLLAGRHKAFIDDTAPIYYLHNQSFDICDDDNFHQLVGEIISKNIGLVVLDTISGIHDLEENSAKEMKLVTKKLLNIIKLSGASILYVHHHRKKLAGENYSQGSAR